ncbi:ATP-dependent DNA helicase sgs1 [Puccinia graminis f. sp. tritici]|uniref:DNA 3'-5' helicase n=1 Tax=Puccinia graminis f. sp. tritici TaxID=56615 RepID=A0A5B0SLL6_PUCGR|nr:ATP-dependent DNA helicase sgs1 [Puccinia graminis f. sp. tritici]
MSATCRPVVLEAITSNLKLQPEDIKLINGELTRPEIRLIRISMQSTLKSADDLLRIYAPNTMVPSEKVVPTIIYSGTRNATFQVMKVVNEARQTKWHEYDPEDSFIRRFHSVTGDEDKAENMADYAEAKYPVISATMALGLGQNLKRVRCVIHMGRGDPSSIVQMVGRCGRDGKTGLGLLFMEPTRKKGRNDVGSFTCDKIQDDDDRMDALAITPVCLRIALTVDNALSHTCLISFVYIKLICVFVRHGYIPLSVDDPTYWAEQARELKEAFPPCRCSNCDPASAEAFVHLAQQVTVDNFDAILADPFGTPKDQSIVIMTRKAKARRPKGSCQLPPNVAENLRLHLVQDFERFYVWSLGRSAEFLPSDFFAMSHATRIVAHFDQICGVKPHNTDLAERLMGGEFFSGQTQWLNQSLNDWMDGEFYQDILRHEAFLVSEECRLREEIEAGAEALQIEKEAWTAQKKAQARAVVAAAARVRKEASDAAKKQRADEIAAEKRRKSELVLQAKREEQDRKRFEAEMKKAQRAQKQEEEASLKQAERLARNKAAADARALLAAEKAEEKRLRKEAKENNKKRASSNRDLRGKRDLKRQQKRQETSKVLEAHNAQVESVCVGGPSVAGPYDSHGLDGCGELR